MISGDYIREWKNKVPWPLNNQVEQDLIICRALVEIFNHPLLADSLAFRGGTALFKLHYLLARKAFPFSVRWYRWVGLRGESGFVPFCPKNPQYSRIVLKVLGKIKSSDIPRYIFSRNGLNPGGSRRPPCRGR